MKDKEIIDLIRNALAYDQARFDEDSDYVDSRDRLRNCLEVVHDSIRGGSLYVTPIKHVTVSDVKNTDH